MSWHLPRNPWIVRPLAVFCSVLIFIAALVRGIRFALLDARDEYRDFIAENEAS